MRPAGNLQLKAAIILLLIALARSKQDPIDRGHVAQCLYRPPPAGTSRRYTNTKCHVTGTFGKVDAMSEILTEYLQRLEEQQESVMQLIKNQRQLLKEGKAGGNLQALKSAAAKV